jgi:hypothetical protein
MLSNEKPNQLTDAEKQIAFAVAMGHARALATVMVNHDHNPDPHPERNAPNPAAEFISVRVIKPRRMAHVTVSQDVKDHNDIVANLGRKPC